jgi:hypothetical protein
MLWSILCCEECSTRNARRGASLWVFGKACTPLLRAVLVYERHKTICVEGCRHRGDLEQRTVIRPHERNSLPAYLATVLCKGLQEVLRKLNGIVLLENVDDTCSDGAVSTKCGLHAHDHTCVVNHSRRLSLNGLAYYSPVWPARPGSAHERSKIRDSIQITFLINLMVRLRVTLALGDLAWRLAPSSAGLSTNMESARWLWYTSTKRHSVAGRCMIWYYTPSNTS